MGSRGGRGGERRSFLFGTSNDEWTGGHVEVVTGWVLEAGNNYGQKNMAVSVTLSELPRGEEEEKRKEECRVSNG